MILMTDNNGRHIDEKLLQIVKLYHRDNDFQAILKNNNIQYIDVAATIYRPSTDKAALDSARLKFLSVLKVWNALLPKMNVSLKIREVAFPKQLKTAADKHLTYTA